MFSDRRDPLHPLGPTAGMALSEARCATTLDQPILGSHNCHSTIRDHQLVLLEQGEQRARDLAVVTLRQPEFLADRVRGSLEGELTQLATSRLEWLGLGQLENLVLQLLRHGAPS